MWNLTVTSENCKSSPRKPSLPHIHWVFISQENLMAWAKVKSAKKGEEREGLRKIKGTDDLWEK